MVAGLLGRRVTSPQYTIPPNNNYYVNYEQVPLESVAVKALVHDFSCQVTIEQSYYNSEPFPLEIKYEFPLADAAVAKFEAIFPEDTIRGIVKEKAAAKKEFEAAVAVGKQAALLEQDSKDTFTCTVGNLKPNERCTIRITTVGEIKMVNGVTQFVLPMVVAPPPLNRPSLVQLQSSSNNRNGAPVPYRLTFNLDLWMPSVIKFLRSTTHTFIIEKKSAYNWSVELGDGSTQLDKDLVLDVIQEQPYGSRCIIERFQDLEGKSGFGQKSMALQATFCEKTLDIQDVMAGELTAEFIFVVDTSGSMQGSPLENTKNCLQIFLRSLPEGSMFNVYNFDSYFHSVFPSSRAYNDQSLMQATQFVAGLRADNSTELLPPLNHIFNSAPVFGFPRQVFILTDGEVSNSQQCIEVTKKNAHLARVFTFGIGNSVSRPLVEGIAKAGGGAPEFIVDNSKIAQQVSAQLARALQPAITGISVDWGAGYRAIEGTPAIITDSKGTQVTNVDIRQCPSKMPAIYPGNRYFIYGLIDRDNLNFAERFEVKIKAHFSNGGERVIPIMVEPGKNNRVGSMIHKLAARARIKELEADSSNISAKGEVLYLSLKYQISSQSTSFVAVSDKPPSEPPMMQPIKREVPQEAKGLVSQTRTNSTASGSVDLLGLFGSSSPPPAPTQQYQRQSTSNYASADLFDGFAAAPTMSVSSSLSANPFAAPSPAPSPSYYSSPPPPPPSSSPYGGFGGSVPTPTTSSGGSWNNFSMAAPQSPGMGMATGSALRKSSNSPTASARVMSSARPTSSASLDPFASFSPTSAPTRTSTSVPMLSPPPSGPPMPNYAMPSQSYGAPIGGPSSGYGRPTQPLQPSYHSMPSPSYSSTSAYSQQPVVHSGRSDPYISIIQSQKVDGSWPLDIVITSGGLTKTPTVVRGIWTAWLGTWLTSLINETKQDFKSSDIAFNTGGGSLAQSARDSGHPQHDLQLVMGAYKDKGLYMKCDKCGETCSDISAPAYHCEPCGYDCHPECLAPNPNQSYIEIGCVIGTLLALAALSRKYGAKKGEWIILASKARAFLLKRWKKYIVPLNGGTYDFESRMEAIIESFATAAASASAV